MSDEQGEHSPEGFEPTATPGSEPELPVPQPEPPIPTPAPEPPSPEIPAEMPAPQPADLAGEAVSEPVVTPEVAESQPVSEAEPAAAEPAAERAAEPETAEGEEPAAQPEPAEGEEPAAEGETAEPDPAAEGEAVVGSEAEAELGYVKPHIPWWPFLSYLAVWIIALGASAYVLYQSPMGLSITEQRLYPIMLLTGLALTIAGPLLVFVVWLVVWVRASGSERKGLFTQSLIRGAIVTLSGVLLWWIMLATIDYLRLGRLL